MEEREILALDFGAEKIWGAKEICVGSVGGRRKRGRCWRARRACRRGGEEAGAVDRDDEENTGGRNEWTSPTVKQLVSSILDRPPKRCRACDPVSSFFILSLLKFSCHIIDLLTWRAIKCHGHHLIWRVGNSLTSLT